MNREERAEWEALCRQYNVDSLYEAIQGCREELEFLAHCAARLEPRTDEEADEQVYEETNEQLYEKTDKQLYEKTNEQPTPFNTTRKRRSSLPENAV